MAAKSLEKEFWIFILGEQVASAQAVRPSSAWVRPHLRHNSTDPQCDPARIVFLFDRNFPSNKKPRKNRGMDWKKQPAVPAAL